MPAVSWSTVLISAFVQPSQAGTQLGNSQKNKTVLSWSRSKSVTGKITPEEKPRSLKERGPFRCSRSMQRRVAGQGLHGEDGKQQRGNSHPGPRAALDSCLAEDHDFSPSYPSRAVFPENPSTLRLGTLLLIAKARQAPPDFRFASWMIFGRGLVYLCRVSDS